MREQSFNVSMFPCFNRLGKGGLRSFWRITLLTFRDTVYNAALAMNGLLTIREIETT